MKAAARRLMSNRRVLHRQLARLAVCALLSAGATAALPQAAAMSPDEAPALAEPGPPTLPGPPLPAPPPAASPVPSLPAPHSGEIGLLFGVSRQRSDGISGVHALVVGDAKTDVNLDQAPASREYDLGLDLWVRAAQIGRLEWRIGGDLALAVGTFFAVRFDLGTEGSLVLGPVRVGAGVRGGVVGFGSTLGRTSSSVAAPDGQQYDYGADIKLSGHSLGWAPFVRASVDITERSAIGIRAGWRFFQTAAHFSLEITEDTANGSHSSDLPTNWQGRGPTPIFMDGPFVDVSWFAF